jgi:GGDEF domain-containing protein
VILLATIGLPMVSRLSVSVYLLVWTAIYVFIRLALWSGASAIEPGVQFASWLAELAAIGLVVFLSRDLLTRLKDWDDVVEKLLLPDAGAKVRTLEQALGDIHKELVRSRRHHHPLSVIVVEPEHNSIRMNLQRVVQLIQEAVATRYLVVQIGSVLSGMLRRTDMIVEGGGQGRFIILCPEIDVAASQELLERIQSAVAKVGLSVTCGMCAFPEGAVTLDEVVEFAKSPLLNAASTISSPAWHSSENQTASPIPVTRELR